MQIAVAQAEGVRGIIPKHEQNASFMACGYALFSGKLGVCFSTAGPGAFNLMSGVCVALNGSLPLIAITGYATMAYDGRGQANETSGLVRTPNSRMVWDAVVKKDPATGAPANYLITKVEDVVPIMHKAVEVALTGRPGPVQVAVAWNITAPTFQVTNYSPPRIDRRPVAPNAGRDRKRRRFPRRKPSAPAKRRCCGPAMARSAPAPGPRFAASWSATRCRWSRRWTARVSSPRTTRWRWACSATPATNRHRRCFSIPTWWSRSATPSLSTARSTSARTCSRTASSSASTSTRRRTTSTTRRITASSATPSLPWRRCSRRWTAASGR